MPVALSPRSATSFPTAPRERSVRSASRDPGCGEGRCGCSPTSAPARDAAGSESISAGGLYRECLNVKQRGWFGLKDCAYRYSLTVLLFYFTLFTTPVSFTRYTWKYCMLWWGHFGGFLMFLTYPIMPVGIALLVIFKYFQSYFVADWSMAGAGRVFFLKPKNPLAAFLWDCYLSQSMFVGQFYLVGENEDAIQHTYKDILLTKDFWRKTLSSVGARLPRELARWTGEKLKPYHPVGASDVVVKVPDSFLGIGDSFWNNGKDFNSEEELRQKLAQSYAGKEAMVLELCRPKKSLGVHSLDIVTLRRRDGSVKVLSALLWTDCTDSSSHSCRAGYIVDVDSELIVAPTRWYSPAFAQMQAPLVGQRMRGIRKACETAVRAHEAIEEKWLTSVGWDCMIMEDEVVFFEGNFAGARTPRRIFLSWASLKEFVRNWAWRDSRIRPDRELP
eukprot:TRINITY_DN65880_c0_g1_i1.p1 TRINITY_DN65880_c0_g1~~TRINITY_DN65880_c0_g1_i1.p1  ORF type:complete len:483 (+),score=152.30 TRINITY_DN65880_c0_g1_i1:113-1450(+)